jgi:hypothetical protein
MDFPTPTCNFFLDRENQSQYIVFAFCKNILSKYDNENRITTSIEMI